MIRGVRARPGTRRIGETPTKALKGIPSVAGVEKPGISLSIHCMYRLCSPLKPWPLCAGDPPDDPLPRLLDYVLAPLPRLQHHRPARLPPTQRQPGETRSRLPNFKKWSKQTHTEPKGQGWIVTPAMQENQLRDITDHVRNTSLALTNAAGCPKSLRSLIRASVCW